MMMDSETKISHITLEPRNAEHFKVDNKSSRIVAKQFVFDPAARISATNNSSEWNLPAKFGKVVTGKTTWPPKRRLPSKENVFDNVSPWLLFNKDWEKKQHDNLALPNLHKSKKALNKMGDPASKKFLSPLQVVPLHSSQVTNCFSTKLKKSNYILQRNAGFPASPGFTSDGRELWQCTPRKSRSPVIAPFSDQKESQRERKISWGSGAYLAPPCPTPALTRSSNQLSVTGCSSPLTVTSVSAMSEHSSDDATVTSRSVSYQRYEKPAVTSRSVGYQGNEKPSNNVRIINFEPGDLVTENNYLTDEQRNGIIMRNVMSLHVSLPKVQRESDSRCPSPPAADTAYDIDPKAGRKSNASAKKTTGPKTNSTPKIVITPSTEKADLFKRPVFLSEGRNYKTELAPVIHSGENVTVSMKYYCRPNTAPNDLMYLCDLHAIDRKPVSKDDNQIAKENTKEAFEKQAKGKAADKTLVKPYPYLPVLAKKRSSQSFQSVRNRADAESTKAKNFVHKPTVCKACRNQLCVHKCCRYIAMVNPGYDSSEQHQKPLFTASSSEFCANNRNIRIRYMNELQSSSMTLQPREAGNSLPSSRCWQPPKHSHKPSQHQAKQETNKENITSDEYNYYARQHKRKPTQDDRSIKPKPLPPIADKNSSGKSNVVIIAEDICDEGAEQSLSSTSIRQHLLQENPALLTVEHYKYYDAFADARSGARLSVPFEDLGYTGHNMMED